MNGMTGWMYVPVHGMHLKAFSIDLIDFLQPSSRHQVRWGAHGQHSKLMHMGKSHSGSVGAHSLNHMYGTNGTCMGPMRHVWVTAALPVWLEV